MTGLAMFIATIAATLAITAWASRRAGTRDQVYAAEGALTGRQNGLAIAGDFMSATTVLGITGLYLGAGWDTAIYYLAPVAGLALMLLLVAAPLRRLGRFTLGDVMTSRLDDPRLRLFSGVGTIVISLFYLLAQLVGAGTLIAPLFGLSFPAAVAVVGVLMAIYIAFGGMLAASWVQIVKAVLLATSVIGLVLLCLVKAGGLGDLFAGAAAASPAGHALFRPGGFELDLFSAVSLGFGMVVGLVGMPHLLIRFFTVPDEGAARVSVAIAASIVAAINALLFLVVGPAAVAFVLPEPGLAGPDGAILGGSNMATLHLARLTGGETLHGIISAVAFATILAVVSGLTIASASAASHDIFRTLARGRASERAELLVFRASAIVLAAVAIGLAILFQHENIAFLTSLAFAVAASANFPLLMLVLYWRPLTASGALWGGVTGLAGSVLLIVAGPAVWVKQMGHAAPLFPSDYPALVVAPLALLVAVLVSKQAPVARLQAEPR
jgi:cation/acetate symporter